jgi:hypothetical protein
MLSSLQGDYLAYVLAEITVLGAGTTWDAQVGDPTTWNDVTASGKSWLQIFTLTEAPVVDITLKYGNNNPPENEAKRMEILSTVISDFRYIQVEITITDTGPGIRTLVEEFDLILQTAGA